MRNAITLEGQSGVQNIQDRVTQLTTERDKLKDALNKQAKLQVSLREL